MALTKNLGIDSSRLKSRMCVTGPSGHFWYREGRWEKLQADGSYLPCDEPKAVDGMYWMDAETCETLKRDSAVATLEKWTTDFDRTTTIDHKACGIDTTGYGPVGTARNG